MVQSCSYLSLYVSGELKKRLQRLKNRLSQCDLCPRLCRVNRNETNQGYCRSGHRAYICSYCDHHGEEPPLSGTNGSGTIFFGNCNLRFVFCQNADKIALLARTLKIGEYEEVLRTMEELHLDNSLYQELNAALFYRPHFWEGDHPFD